MTLPARITDDQVADLPLDAALDALLAELRAEAPTAAPRRRWPVVAAAAASVAVAVAAVPLLLGSGDDPGADPGADPAGGPPATSPAVSGTPTPTQEATTDVPLGPAPVDPADAVTATWVGRDEWVVLDAPGWEPAYVDSSPPAGLGLTWTSGGAEFSVQWEEERWYRSRYREAQRDAGGATIDLLGQPAPLVAFESQQQFAFLPVDDGYGFYVNASFTSQSQFADLVASLRGVDTRAFDAAMPPGTLAPDRVEAVATDLLADAELPPGFRVRLGGWSSRLGVAGTLVGRLHCDWTRAWADARASGDEAAARRAERAMAAAPRWDVLAAADDREAFDYTLRSIREGRSAAYVVDTAC